MDIVQREIHEGDVPLGPLTLGDITNDMDELLPATILEWLGADFDWKG